MLPKHYTFDVETTGLNPYLGHTIFAYVITDKDLNSKVYRLDWTSDIKTKVAIETLQKFCLNKTHIKVAHNSKFELSMLLTNEHIKKVNGKWHDTFILSKILRNLLHKHELGYLANKYISRLDPNSVDRWNNWDLEVKRHLTKQKRLLNNNPKKFVTEILEPVLDSGITPFVTNSPNYGLVPVDVMRQYQISDGERAELLYQLMYPEIIKDSAIYADFLNEMQLIKVSQRMEKTGLMVHVRKAKNLIKLLKRNLKNIEDNKLKLFGFNINLSSNDQIQKHFFGHIDPKKHKVQDQLWKIKQPVFKLIPQGYTSTGAPSTNKESLIALNRDYENHPAVDMLIKHRAWSRGIPLISSYLSNLDNDDVIHPNINTNQASTGRQSVSNPSLQNVSKENSSVSILSIPARQCFRPRPNKFLLLGDYSGIEMRLIIDASGEQELIDKLNQDPFFDVHTFNCKEWFENKWEYFSEKEKKELRANVKTAGFGRCYGAGFEAFAGAFKISNSEAKILWNNFKKKRPALFNFSSSLSSQVYKNGYITTTFGRKLYIYKDLAYTAANYRIQGDAAGILKRAEINCNNYLKDVWNYDTTINLTVHDEIIFECIRKLFSLRKEIAHDLSFYMTDIPEIKVPLTTEWKIATTTWGDAYEENIFI